MMQQAGKYLYLLLLLSLHPVDVFAEQDWRTWPMGDRFSIGVAYFHPKLDTSVAIADEHGNIGTAISLENNLNLDDSLGTFMFGASWRFLKRHSLRLTYFDLDRSSFEPGNGQVMVGDEVIDVTLPVETFFNVEAYEISYSYSLLFTSRQEFALGLGVSMQNLDFGVQGTSAGGLFGEIPPGESIKVNFETTTPLPTLTGRYLYAFNDEWVFGVSAGWLAVELNLEDKEELEGHIVQANFGLRWQPFQNMGFRFAYQKFDVDVKFQKRDLVGNIDYDYRGPVIGIELLF